MRRFVVSALVLLTASSTAEASSTLACSFKHPAIAVTFEGNVSHGMGEQLTDARGDVDVAEAMIQSDLKHLTIGRADITQFWLTGKDLKMRLYRDSTSGPGENLEIIMEATGTMGEFGMSFKGAFKATLSHLEPNATEAKSKTVTGKLTCSSD